MTSVKQPYSPLAFTCPSCASFNGHWLQPSESLKLSPTGCGALLQILTEQTLEVYKTKSLPKTVIPQVHELCYEMFIRFKRASGVLRGMSALDESLLSLEKLDRTSPELWPESIPGVSEYMYLKSNAQSNLPQPWNQPLEAEDQDLLRYYGSLSVSDLISEVKRLHDTAYRLGVDEAKEMTRGKYLNILENRKKR